MNMITPPTTRVAPEELKLISDTIVAVKPKIVLESGTGYGGGSTTTIARTLKDLNFGKLYSYETYKPFYDVAAQHMINIGCSSFAEIKNEDFVKAIKSYNESVFDDVGVVFLDGGDEAPDGSWKLGDVNLYYNNLDLSENVQSFKFLENKLKSGTHVFLHDWITPIGRGYLVSLYLKNISYSGWKLVNVISHTETGMGHLIKL